MLRQLRTAMAFDPSPLRRELQDTHVPFEVLVPGHEYETRACEALADNERLAVVGRTGSGKSSFIAYVFAHAAGVAPIRVSVAAEEPEVVREPAAFAGHLIRELERQVSEARGRSRRSARRQLDSATKVTLQRQRGLRGTIGPPSWLLQGNLAAELESVIGATVPRSTADLFSTGEQAIAAIAAAQGFPVIVIDDSDTWLRTELDDRSELVGHFFGRVLPRVSQDWAVGLCVAVHEEYLSMPAYPRREGWITSEIALPLLTGPVALGEILASRVRVFFTDVGLSEVMAEQAVSELYRVYENRSGNLRQVMLLAHTALALAVDEGAEQVQANHVVAALARVGR